MRSKGDKALKRADEEFCRKQFDTFIKQFYAIPEVTWEEVAQRNEPPDYYVCLGNTRFAVEVTAIMEVVSIGGSSPLPHSEIGRLLEQYVENVEKLAIGEGSLHGNYIVLFSAPIANLTDVEGRVKGKLLEYIRRTRDLDIAPLETVFVRNVGDQRPQQCEIQKVGSKPNSVLGGGPVWVKWKGEAAEGICDLLNYSLSSKARKLKSIEEPKILLLLDEYLYADRQMYEDCVHRLSALTQFHTVFVVQSENKGFPLYSCNRGWLDR